jgi:diguanylate cyclase (GGDEF)-like protein
VIRYSLPFAIAFVAGALMVMLGTLVAYRHRRRHAREAARAAAEDAAQERARLAQLERLMSFGRALGAALDPSAIIQVFWRYLPAFAEGREVWMITRTPQGWGAVVSEAASMSPRTKDLLEGLAREALDGAAFGDVTTYGALLDDYLCFPMLVGQTAVGVVGVRNAPAIELTDHAALSAAVALLAIAIRNNQLLAETRENSIRDGLTGCYNRTYGVDTLASELRRSTRTGCPTSVLMIDIDEFKAVNDRHGHLVGDAMLAAIGEALAQLLRSTDVKCRYGGDEFLVILPDTPLAGAERVAAAITSVIANLSIPTPTGPISPTLSLGVAVAAEGQTDVAWLIALADGALYRAKRAGRNRFAAAPFAAAV